MGKAYLLHLGGHPVEWITEHLGHGTSDVRSAIREMQTMVDEATRKRAASESRRSDRERAEERLPLVERLLQEMLAKEGDVAQQACTRLRREVVRLRRVIDGE